MTKSITIDLLIIICILLFSSNVNAYIDPGTGSLLLQGLIAGIAAGLYTIKLYWYRIKNFFTRGEEDLDVDPDENE